MSPRGLNAPIVAVAGPMGAGKSTWTACLAERLGFEAFIERFDENPYLEPFYDDPRKWALRSILWFLQATGSAVASSRRAGPAIIERCLSEHVEIFGAEFRARSYLSDDEFALVSRIGRLLEGGLDGPDLLLYLAVEPAEAVRRVRLRGHPVDRATRGEYLTRLQGRYEAWVAAWSRSPVLRFDTTQCDVRDPAVGAEIAAEIERRLRGPRGAGGGPARAPS